MHPRAAGGCRCCPCRARFRRMGLSQRLRDLDARAGQKPQRERRSVTVAAALLGLASVFLIAEVFGGPYGIAIFPLAVIGGIEAGRVMGARAARRGQGLRP